MWPKGFFVGLDVPTKAVSLLFVKRNRKKNAVSFAVWLDTKRLLDIR